MVRWKPNFLLLAISRFISNLGTSIFNFAMSLYVLDLTGSASAFSLVISFTILPRIFINIFASVFVDRYDKKKIIILTDLFSGALVIFFMFIFRAQAKEIILIFLYVTVLTLFQSVFNLAINASVPNIVHKENVPRANAAFQGIGAAINILGPVFGAIAYEAVGMEMIFLLNGVSFIISGIGEIFLRFYKNDEEETIPEAETYFRKISLVFNYLKKQKAIAFFLAMAVLINFLYNPLMMMVVKYITYTYLQVSVFQLSVIQAGWAAGAIFGAVYISVTNDTDRIFRSFFQLLIIQGGLIICWLFPLIIKIPDPQKWMVTSIFCFILVIIGALNTIQNIPLISYFQVRVPENLRARVFGVFTTAFLISSPLGLFLYGFLLEKIHWSLITGLSGIIMIAFSLVSSRHKIYKAFVAKLNSKQGN